jgi:hypothetical protein
MFPEQFRVSFPGGSFPGNGKTKNRILKLVFILIPKNLFMDFSKISKSGQVGKNWLKKIASGLSRIAHFLDRLYFQEDFYAGKHKEKWRDPFHKDPSVKIVTFNPKAINGGTNAASLFTNSLVGGLDGGRIKKAKSLAK